MRQAIRTMISRVLAAPLAALVAWMGVPAATGEELTAAVTTAIALALYGVLHKGFDALGINRSDDAGGAA